MICFLTKITKLNEKFCCTLFREIYLQKPQQNFYFLDFSSFEALMK